MSSGPRGCSQDLSVLVRTSGLWSGPQGCRQDLGVVVRTSGVLVRNASALSLQAETEQVAKTSCAEFSLIAHTRTSPYTPQPDPAPSSADPTHPKEESRLITVPLVVKGDVAGSVEALVGILSSRQPQGVQLRVVQSGVGPISDSDMDMAISTKGTRRVGG